MKKELKKDSKEGLTFGVIVGLTFGVIAGVIVGVIAGVIVGFIVGVIVGFIVGVIVGLIYGLIFGLSITFWTQLIGLITSNPEFAMLDFVLSGLLIILIEVIGWIIIKRLK